MNTLSHSATGATFHALLLLFFVVMHFQAFASEIGSNRGSAKTSQPPERKFFEPIIKDSSPVKRRAAYEQNFADFMMQHPLRQDLTLSCRNDRRVPDGATKHVSQHSSDLCKRMPSWLPDVKQGEPIAYTLTKSRGKLIVDLKVYFNYKGDEKNRTAVIKRLEIARTCTQDFYGRFGLTLNLNFKVNSGLRDWWNSDTAINVWDKTRRANSGNWAMLERKGVPMDRDAVCALASHELGHSLGLPDLYPDPDCPDRERIGRYDNIMRSGSWDPIDSVRIYPEEMKTIIAPLCGG